MAFDLKKYTREYEQNPINRERRKILRRNRRFANLEVVREKGRKAAQKWRAKNPERAKRVSREAACLRRVRYPEAKKEEGRIYRLENQAQINERARERSKETRKEKAQYVRERRHNDSTFHLISNIRIRINAALKGNSKSLRTIELIGCRWSELRMWLEFQFQDGMTWENYGPVWHVDHIEPCARFDLSKPEQQKECFNYKNLQPLFAFDNMSKGAKYNRE